MRTYAEGIYVVQAIEKQGASFRTLADDERPPDPEAASVMRARLAGETAPIEPAALEGGRSFLSEWRGRRRELKEATAPSIAAPPWGECDTEMVRRFARMLAQSVADDVAARELVTERLLDGRTEIDPAEARQIVLLFGRPDMVRQVTRRPILDLRARQNPDTRWDERREVDANVFASLFAALEFLNRHTGEGGLTPDGLRATSGSADYIALREGLVNLFIHQDYADTGTAAQIEIAPERAVLHNAGRSLVDEAALVDGARSTARNPLIARALKLVGFAELAGSGLREVYRVWRQARRRPPIVRSDETANTFTLTLDWRPLREQTDAFWQARLGVKLSPEQARALALAASPEGTSAAEISSALGAQLEDARQIVDWLVRQGLALEVPPRLYIADHLREAAYEAEGAQSN